MEALLDLTWDRVNFLRGHIHLHAPSRTRNSKGRAIVPMNETARAALVEARQGAVTDHVIEWSGGRIRSVKRAINTCLRRTGLKTRGDGVHLLRHTAAVLMAESGVPIDEIAQYLGHSNSNTTAKVYARYSPDYLQGAATALNLPTTRLRVVI